MASSICRVNNLLMPEPANRLTPKQIECLERVAEGMTSKEIARELGISSHTVDDHVEKARIKLNAPTRLRAAALFRAQLASSANSTSQKQNPPPISSNFEEVLPDRSIPNLPIEIAITTPDWAPQRIGPEPLVLDDGGGAEPTQATTPVVNDGGLVPFGHFPSADEPQSVSARPKEAVHQPPSSLSTTLRILAIAAVLALIVLAFPQLVHGAEVIAAFILKTTSSSRGAVVPR